MFSKSQGKMANILSVMAGGNDGKTSSVEPVPKDEQDKVFYG